MTTCSSAINKPKNPPASSEYAGPFPGSEPETPWRMPDIGAEKYDAPTIRCALDVLVNTLLTLLWTAKNN